MSDKIKCQESYDAGYEKGAKIGYDDGYDIGNEHGYSEGTSAGYTEGYAEGTEKGPFGNSQKDDLRWMVKHLKKSERNEAIYYLCRALGDATEAAEVVRNEWRRM